MILQNEHGRKIGVVYIDGDMVKRDPQTVQALFSRIIPLRVELRPERWQYEVFALSEFFEVVPPGMYAPEYTVRVHGRGADASFEFVPREKDDWSPGWVNIVGERNAKTCA